MKVTVALHLPRKAAVRRAPSRGVASASRDSGFESQRFLFSGGALASGAGASLSVSPSFLLVRESLVLGLFIRSGLGFVLSVSVGCGLRVRVRIGNVVMSLYVSGAAHVDDTLHGPEGFTPGVHPPRERT